MNTAAKHTSDYIRQIRSLGRYAFTVDELEDSLTKTKVNIRKDLDRLREKGEILNVRRGFYTVIPDEYRNMGALPVELYIDDLMKYLDRKYYVGLYSAAMLHGAAHQQPQEYYVVTDTPKLRKISKERLVINFSEKRKFPDYGIEEKKTETGYLKVSNAALTFFDLIYFEKILGGMNRIITILDELQSGIGVAKFKESLRNDLPLTVLQRSGYILEHVFSNEDLSGILEKKLKGKNIRSTPLSTCGKDAGKTDPKWKVMVNQDIASEL